MSNGRLYRKNRLRDLALGAVAIILTCGLLFVAPLAAQTPGPGAHADAAAPDPIKCWWKTDQSAVEVGEHFTLTLQCGVGATIVPKMEELDPGALQLTPFDVLSGTRHEDIQAPPWRYFQYEYTLRLIGQDFGKDVEMPALTVTYNVQSGVAGASGGRDQMYVLPAIPIRILSLVPQKANDIRDSTGESRRSQSAVFPRHRRVHRRRMSFVGVLMLAFAVVRVFRGSQERVPWGLLSCLRGRSCGRACRRLGVLSRRWRLRAGHPSGQDPH